MSLSGKNLGWQHSREKERRSCRKKLQTEKNKFLVKYRIGYVAENEECEPIAKMSEDYYHQQALRVPSEIQLFTRFIGAAETPPLRQTQSDRHIYYRAYFVVPDDISDGERKRLVDCGASYIEERLFNQLGSWPT